MGYRVSVVALLSTLACGEAKTVAFELPPPTGEARSILWLSRDSERVWVRDLSTLSEGE